MALSPVKTWPRGIVENGSAVLFVVILIAVGYLGVHAISEKIIEFHNAGMEEKIGELEQLLDKERELHQNTESQLKDAEAQLHRVPEIRSSAYLVNMTGHDVTFETFYEDHSETHRLAPSYGILIT